MTKWKRFCLVLSMAAVLASLVAVPAVAAEEDSISFENVRLWLYPEYDRNSLLVMLQGDVIGGDDSATVSFLVPTTAVMYSAGSVDAADAYSGGPPDRLASEVDGWDIISYEMTSATFRVEYYDDIIRGDVDRSIDYQFRTVAPIADLVVYANEPVGSRDYAVTGNDTFTPVDYDEFESRLQAHRSTYQSLEGADVLDFRIVYARNTIESSLSLLDPSFSSDPPSSEGSGTGTAVAVAIMVIAVLGGGTFWIYRAKRTSDHTPVKDSGPVKQTRPTRQRSGMVTPAVGKTRSGRFCTNCGELMSPGDLFCGGCGAAIK